MDTSTLLDEFVSAILSRDGERFAKLFAPDGTYDDVFYGVHRGREDIAHMVNDRFYETADDFRWDMVNPVRQGDMIYSRVIFSYVSSLPGAMKPRVLMESVSMMRLKDGLIQEYTEVVNNGPSLVECGLPPEHVAKILNRQGQKLRNKPEAQRHLA
ncbi:MAG: nuclear transport factor 2 family protein [Rhodobiaceae bacterium]|nr:nuclear transport factor 2 family protein [Rhodobiaceae bacterium]MCC0057418.1 nuclear transport factor 2 family protein [Rhodobiaceae bacterium]